MTARHTEILAYHGWGFTAACWQDYQTAFENTTWRSFDRGYFGSPLSVEFSAAPCRRVVVAHSYGLHLCPDAVLSQAEILILLNSFLGFHGTEPRLQAKSQRKLQRMLQAFDQDPCQTWVNFIAQTFSPDSIPPNFNLQPDRLQSPLLRQDLEALNHTSLNPDRLRPISQILLLTSPDDRILTAPLHSADLSGEVTEILLPQGGHGAPFVPSDSPSNRQLDSQLDWQANWCIARISEFLDF